MLLTQQLSQLRTRLQRDRRRWSSTSFTMANSTSETLICVAFQSLWTLCSAPGFAMQYCNNSEIVIFYSPMSVATMRREPPCIRCSPSQMPCQVPSLTRPSSTGSISDTPSIDDLMCDGISSGPS